MIAHRDLAPERQERLFDIVRRTGVARIDELREQLDVSPATIRRDLEVLEQNGKIRRVHGGAISRQGRLEEPLFEDKASIATAEKRAIAAKALTMVNAGDTLFLDGGSTILELARMLRDRADITVVTNSLRAAVELCGSELRLIVLGGELRHRSQTIVGVLTRRVIEELHVDTAFMGTIGVSMEAGLTTTDPAEAFTKELVMARAGRVVLLADSGKLGKISFARSGGLGDIDVLITDRKLPAASGKALARKVQLIRV